MERACAGLGGGRRERRRDAGRGKAGILAAGRAARDTVACSSAAGPGALIDSWSGADSAGGDCAAARATGGGEIALAAGSGARGGRGTRDRPRLGASAGSEALVATAGEPECTGEGAS